MSITFHASNRKARVARRALLLGLCGLALLLTPAAGAADLPNLTVMGVAADGTETDISSTDYRWLVEKDETYHVQTVSALVCGETSTSCTSDADCVGIGDETCTKVDTGAADPTTFDPNWQQGNDLLPGGETLAVSFHDSYTPVVAKGCAGTDTTWQAAAACVELTPTLEPDTHYYVSVVPRSGYSIGGAGFKTDADGNVPATTVYVNQHPIPTAQISILIFHDNAPINNAPDLPSEDPANDADGDGVPENPMAGFKIIVEDAGGRYGASAGVQSQDAFGNPLGTTYDAAGNVTGYQPLITGPDGRITIKNLAPGKYGIMAVPPAGQGWQQTSTIEGTKVIDAWVKANEPPFFAEFGPAGFHVFIGFVKEFDLLTHNGNGTALSGTIVNQHLSRPPDYAMYNGGCFGHTTPWVGLNDLAGGGIGTGIYAAATNADCGFTIPDVPDGSYQLVVWDNNLDLIFAFYGITITNGVCSTPNGSCTLGEVPVFQWFHRQEHFVFDDKNADGLYDPLDGETPILEQGFNLRWRDGTVYQGNVSDPGGLYAFDQVFPFFSWLVAEVDFARFQATALTTVVDNGGAIPTGATAPGIFPEEDLTFGSMTAPQDQTNPTDPACALGDCYETAQYRIDYGPVLTAGFQGFIGQTSAFQWGKRHYPDGENGGISGIVFYAVTRAENDPELAAGEVWEPGIPGVTVKLYASGGVDPISGVATKGALLNTTTTDSWDDSIPTGCKYGNGGTAFQWSNDGTTFLDTDCYDGLRVFNQVRPAVFDGGYAFDSVCADSGGMLPDGSCTAFTSPMPVGEYIVEVIAPPGYEILKPEDKNVDFGDEYQPAPELLPPPCVGPLHLIPDYLTLFPDEQIPAPFAGTSRPLCDTKLVTLSSGANAAADFWLFTEVPVAAKGFGFILDDTQNEFDPNSPQFGEKYAPPFVPVTVRDWTGRIISKTLSDQYGRYNFLAPSTITTNLPAPSGMSPNMLTTCMNDPGDDPNNPDPNWNQQYSTFCYTFQYMPGVTTYLDTPVVPVAAYTGPDQFPLDCEYADGTPRIYSADVQTNVVGGGPYIPLDNQGRVAGDQTIIITSMGLKPVQNPDYCNPAAGACPLAADTINKFVTRDFSFGVEGDSVVVNLGDLGDFPATVDAQGKVSVTVLGGTQVTGVGGRQLTVTRANGRSTKVGVTVQVGLRQGANAVVVGPTVPQALSPLDHTIQNAIDAAGANDLIMVRPSTYNELVVMWKPVQLQGFGEGSTTINAVKAPAEKLDIWRGLVDGLIAGNDVSLLPGQEVGAGAPEPVTLWTEEGAGILVLAAAGGNSRFERDRNRGARIDGFTVKSADTGGGIIANGYANYLDISNNRIANNQGFYGGGIRVGHPTLTFEQQGGGIAYTDAENNYVDIHHNQVVFNGGQNGAGGGISMCTGADSYQITDNWVCGNYALTDGGGIAHYGRSDGQYALAGTGQNRSWSITQKPLIKDNVLIFNESFFQGATVSGGGLFIGGAAPLTPGGLTPGAGNVRVIGNLIQGNSAGAGDGGGIRLGAVNGQDVAANPTNGAPQNQNGPRPWFAIDVFNNMIVNNLTALAGGGMSLQDAVDVRIIHNTIANNDSVATAGEAFAPGSPDQSTPQPGAGIVARSHSSQLAAASGSIGTFSEPSVLADNIVWHNRQFYFWVDMTTGCVPGDTGCTSTFGLCPDPTGALDCTGLTDPTAIVYNDLGVIGVGALTCDDCLVDTDPSFVTEYVNGARSSVLQNETTTVIEAPAAFDEGGNFIRPKFGPLALYDDATSPDGDPGVLFGDYHILSTSDAIDAAFGYVCLNQPCAPGLFFDLGFDYDGEPRPMSGADIGADEQSDSGTYPLNQQRTPGSTEVETKVLTRTGK